MALFVEVAGGGPLPEDQALLTLRADGDALWVEARILGHSTGQGLATVFCAMIAQALGCDVQDVTLTYDNGQADHIGAGSFASRSITVIGSAVLDAVNQALATLIEAAGDVMGVPASNIRFDQGTFFATNNTLALAQLVRAVTQGQSEMSFTGCSLRAETFPSGAHVAEVEIDPSTSVTRVVRYTAIDDCGTPMNEALVHAQLHGGIVQGIGEALGEAAVYDEAGQLISGSFMDYQMPRASDSP